MEKLQTLIVKCSTITGSNNRQEVFRKYGCEIKSLIQIIYDPFQKFHVTSKNIDKYLTCHTPNPVNNKYTCLFDLLTALSNREITGHESLQACIDFISEFPTYKSYIYRAINKDLKIRVGTRMVNKAFPFLIPLFSCALGHHYKDHCKKVNNEWTISRKLDGVRCLFYVSKDGKTCNVMSRNGNEYPKIIPGLQHMTESILKLFPNGGVLDGEMTVIDDQGTEYFNIANSLMNTTARLDGKRGKNTLTLLPGQKLFYQIFDLVQVDTFQSKQKGLLFQTRQNNLHRIYDENKEELQKFCQILKQYPIKETDSLWNMSRKNNWEGLMYRKNTYYKGKKSSDLLKRKLVFEAEYEVLEVKNENIMQPGTTTEQSVCGHFKIKHKDCDVWVGSGLSWNQRVNFANNENILSNGKRSIAQNSCLIGQHVTIAYTEEITTVKKQHSTYSLRFPRLKAVHGSKRTK
jgi:ATP-dependent DNA ligase